MSPSPKNPLIFSRFISPEIASFKAALVTATSKAAQSAANTPGVYKVDLSMNLLIRLVHLVLDEICRPLMDLIFGGVTKELRRQMVDDKTLRTIEQWRHVADTFYNNILWKPQSVCDDTRCTGLDPSQAPTTPLSPEQLRALFTDVRTKYTKLNANYKASGQLQEGLDHGDGDDDFWLNFCRQDPVYFYVHLAYGRCPPSYCMRDMDAAQQCDEGIPGARALLVANGSEETPKKRSDNGFTKADFLEIVQTAMTTKLSKAAEANLVADTERKIAATARDVAMKWHVLKIDKQKDFEWIKNQLSGDNNLLSAGQRLLMERKLVVLFESLFGEEETVGGPGF